MKKVLLSHIFFTYFIYISRQLSNFKTKLLIFRESLLGHIEMVTTSGTSISQNYSRALWLFDECLSSILLLVRQHASDTASWVFHVTRSSWDQMNMAVKDRLPSVCSRIYSYVESCDGRIVSLESCFALVQELMNCIDLRLMKIEIIWDVSLGDD